MLCQEKHPTELGSRQENPHQWWESANLGFTHDCTKFFKSGPYLHTIEVKNMLSGNPKVGSGMKKRFIHFDLVVRKDAKETEGNECGHKGGVAT